MIVKFHARGVGKGSGPVDYLLGKQREREGATLDRGSPSEVQELIDSSPYAKNTRLVCCPLKNLIFPGRPKTTSCRVLKSVVTRAGSGSVFLPLGRASRQGTVRA